MIAIAIGLGRRKIVVYKMTASKLITDERLRHDMDSAHYYFSRTHMPRTKPIAEIGVTLLWLVTSQLSLAFHCSLPLAT